MICYPVYLSRSAISPIQRYQCTFPCRKSCPLLKGRLLAQPELIKVRFRPSAIARNEALVGWTITCRSHSLGKRSIRALRIDLRIREPSFVFNTSKYHIGNRYLAQHSLLQVCTEPHPSQNYKLYSLQHTTPFYFDGKWRSKSSFPRCLEISMLLHSVQSNWKPFPISSYI